MTASLTAINDTVVTDRDAPPPPLREDLDLYPGPRQPDGSPTWTLHDPVRNRFFNVGWLEFEFLKRWGRDGLQELVSYINRETPLSTTKEHALALHQFLERNELLQVRGAAAVKRFTQRFFSTHGGNVRKALHNYLFFRVPLVRPDRFLSRTLPYIRFVYTRGFAWSIVLLTTIGLALVMRQWESFQNTFSYAFSVKGFLLFAFTLFLTKLFHEFGHAYTAKYYGLKVPTMGVAFLVLWPVLYTDTSESWKLTSRKSRLAIGSAGMLAELSLAGIATLIWSFLPEGPLKSAAFFVAAVSWVFTLLININPFMRWDGYYLLADFLGIQNLQERAFALARWALREWLFDFGEPPPEAFPRNMRRTLLLYAYATWLYRFVLFLGIAVLVYYLFFKLAGLFLAAVELYYFIGRPIWSEVQSWGQRKRRFSWNFKTLRTLSLLAGIIALLCLPWTSHVSAPALQRPQVRLELYAPSPARVRATMVENGQTVEAGAVLITLESPDLEHKLVQTERQVALLQSQLARQSASEFPLERRHVIEQQLAASLAKREGYARQREQLRLVAPFPGEVHDIPDALVPGRWVNDKLVLGRLVNRRDNSIIAYLKEGELGRVHPSGSGRFYPDEPEAMAFDVHLSQIDRASARVFSDPYNASVYGGDVAVNADLRGNLVAHEAVYRARLTPVKSLPAPARVYRGVVRLQAESRSVLERMWQGLRAVLIRESGF